MHANGIQGLFPIVVFEEEDALKAGGMTDDYIYERCGIFLKGSAPQGC